MRKTKDKEKFVLATKLLVDATGKKMGKTEGNMVNLDESPNDMLGKIMSWPDEIIIPAFELCTRVSSEEIEEIKRISNPRDQKAKLAFEIVKMFHGEKEAEKASEEFDRVHREGELPAEMEIFSTDRKEYPVIDLLCDAKLVPSRKEAKRLAEAGAVDIDGIVQKDWQKSIEIKDGLVIKVGKRRFVKINLK
jgi:tyrosyl-tRNA synthetase